MTHPSDLDERTLLADTSITRGRSGGPGGQHRNKVETHITMLHRPTGTTAKAGERRSQDENKRVALFRLRLALALAVRTERSQQSALWTGRLAKGRLRCNSAHRDFPSLIAEALDWLDQSDWDGKHAAAQLGLSSSQLVKFVKAYPPAFVRWNEERSTRGLGPLR